MSRQSNTTQPNEPPPPYQEATRPDLSSTSSNTPHKTRNGIPPLVRRSMEDEHRELPRGWLRQYDAKENHQFFVDTTADPPRSIWHHPYDDEQYMLSLSPQERSRIQGLSRAPTDSDIEAESSDDDDDSDGQAPKPTAPAEGPSSARKLGRRVKDALTQSTHEEREARRRKREKEERSAYEFHRRFRIAMAKAAETGEAQLLGRDDKGKDVYVEPPSSRDIGLGGGSRLGGGAYGGGGYGLNPFLHGPYAGGSSRFMRPTGPYSRPYGYGYGGGYGGGLGMPMLGMGAGGLMAGGMAGGMLF